MNNGAVLSRATVEGGGYPSMIGILPPKLDIYHGVLNGYFTVPNCHLTVGVLLYNDESIYLIDPAKAPGASCALIFPQEKVKWMIDGTFGAAGYRGLREELGLKRNDVHFHGEELFRFENHLPLTRTGGIPQTKCIVYFAARVSAGVQFKLNPNEVREVVKMNGDNYLDLGLSSPRSHKCAAQTEVIVSALTSGLLNKRQWSFLKPIMVKTDQVVH